MKIRLLDTTRAACKRSVPLGHRFCLPAMLAAVAAVTTSCEKKQPPAAPPPPIVQVMRMDAVGVPITVEFIGQLDSPQNVEVRARVEAFVEKVLFTEGSELKAGDPLFALDKKPLQQKLAAAEGSLAESQAALKKNETDVARLQPLAAKHAIPQQDLDNAVASVAVGQANVQSAQSRVEAAKIDLGYCDVNAPASGLIGAASVSVGSLVGKGEPTLLATISQLDPIWFYCNIGESQFLRGESEARRTGKRLADLPITLILANGEEHPVKGKIVFLDRAVDTKTGTLRMRTEFANTEKILRPGMFGRIRIDAGVRPDSIAAPERAIVEVQGKQFVWAIDADNKASQRPVKVGETIGDRVVIAEGLKVGERIVTEGLQKVREGAPVQPQAADELARQAEDRRAQGETKPGKE